MDLLLIGAFFGGLFLVIGLWQRHLEQEKHQKTISELSEAKERGTHQAITQFPHIEPYLCFGCGSCIAACPEDGVLGLVNGISHVINGSRCIGHAKCQEVCPVGAITVGLGDVSNRPDIPLLKETMESSVPGIFIAGELGGLALVRNAIDQGARVIEEISRKLNHTERIKEEGVVDVLIVGAGPAGLSAMLKSVEKKFSYHAISQDDVGGTIRKYPRQKLVLVQTVNVPLYGKLSGGEYSKEKLIELWEKLIEKYELKVQTMTSFINTRRKGAYFETETTQGTIVSRSIVLAMGRRGTPRKLGVPGEESEKVLYQLIDANQFNGMNMLVVGGGDSAVEAATALANQKGNVVTMSYRKENFSRLKARNEKRIHEYAASRRVRIIYSSEVQMIEPKQVRLRMMKDGREYIHRVSNDFVIVQAGGDPPYPLLKKIGIQFGGADRQPGNMTRGAS